MRRLVGWASRGLLVLPLFLLSGSARGAEDAAAAAPAAAAVATPKTPWDYVVLPIASYAPETSMALGAGLVLYSNGPKPAANLPRRDDELALVFIATLRRQFISDLEGIQYFKQARYQVTEQLFATRFPNRFWGVGAGTPASAEDLYTPFAAGLELNGAVRTVEEVYVGAGANFLAYRVENVTPGGSVDAYLTAHPRRGHTLGASAFAKRDTRDDPMFARHGSLTLLTVTLARAGAGSTTSYQQYELDHRGFLSLGDRAVLAAEVFGRLASGDVPLDELSALGGGARLRGYFEGRFRDHAYVMSQLELRVRLAWRLSVAPFAAAGNVFPALDAVTLAHPKVAGGLGARINLKKERDLNLRVDVARSPISTGVYVNLGEAF